MTAINIDRTATTLRLRWNYQGRRMSLSLGVKNDKSGNAIAEQRKAEIHKDLLFGDYDPTLLKYKPYKLGENHTEITVVELFEKYIPHHCRERALAESSKVKLKAIAAKLEQFLPDTRAEKVTKAVADKVVAKWLESASIQTVKGYLYLLKSAWEWAKGKYHIADENPWEIALNRSQIETTRRRQQPKQIEVFSIEELEAISSGFKSNHYYAHYADFVAFLINTGGRVGEAVGLRWKHLGTDFTTAWIG